MPMPKDLYLVDLSTFIHAGAVNKRAFIAGPPYKDVSGYREMTFEAGGLSLVLGTLLPHLDHDILICCDRNPTIKKDMHPNYKSNRTHNINIEKQKKLAEIALKYIGLNVVQQEGYEADDFIYSAVKAYKDEYRHIYIYTGDSDLYFLVDDKVTILPSNSRAKKVTRDNYECTVRKNEYTPYNILTMLKIRDGDTSDCIPGVNQDDAVTLTNMFIQSPVPALSADKKYVLSTLGLFAPHLVHQAELVFPLDVGVPLSVEKPVDKNMFVALGRLCQNKKFYYLKGDHDFKELLNILTEEGLYVD